MELIANSHQGWQPFLIGIGNNIHEISSYYIYLDGLCLPIESTTFLSAFNELFACHFVFSVEYEIALHSLYTFLQTTVFKIDISNTKESSKVKELRAKFLPQN